MQKLENPLCLQTICCKEIARHDLVSELEEVAHVLPMEVTEYLLSTLNTYQFVQFHRFFPVGAQEEKLFVEKYKKYIHPSLSSLRFEDLHRVFLGYANELQLCCQFFCARELVPIIHSNRKYGEESFNEISNKAAECVITIGFYPKLAEYISPDQLCRFSNTQSIKLSTNTISQARKIFEFAKRCKLLQRIELSRISFIPELGECLTQFLNYKANKNESVRLQFSRMYEPCGINRSWFYNLGEAIHAISGISIAEANIAAIFEQEWLVFYSQARHIDEIELQNVDNVSTVLSEIAKSSPPQNDNVALSKLKLVEIPIKLETLRSLQHWRFSRLEELYMCRIELGDHGSLMLADHATFWPFVKNVRCIFCNLTTNGLLHLLPAMVHGDGCKKLEVFDISQNKIQKKGLFHVGKFLRSPNTKKLKIFHMDGAYFDESRYTSFFLESLRFTTFIAISLSSCVLNYIQKDRILHAIFSKPNPQL